ncbi:MAG TPA: cation:proton antiporter [Clostridia bacterium]|nr:cation:proton antiporter [Clostridia bacterium]HPJ75934.1 cation:proton antiporter [Clostridia bacterium]HXK72229.1 cation:proton antiporter [Clostridia bacterium]
MLLSIALIFLCALLLSGILIKFKLPGLLGMLIVGIVLGPYVLNLLDDSILNISADLRTIALIVILLKAGLSMNLNDLRKVGRPAILMSFVPASLEIIAFIVFAPMLLGITYLEAGLIGAVMSAVSPAVVIPKMSKLIDEGYGTDKAIPQMIIAGASADDVFVIVIFTSLISIATGGSFSISDLTKIPVSIVLGLIGGIGIGFILVWLFKKYHMRDTIKVLILISISILFMPLEDLLSGIIGFSGLLAIMALGIIIFNRYPVLAQRLSGKFVKLWVAAEIALFVLVGSEVDISYVVNAGFITVVLIFIGLIFRLAGTYLCGIKTQFNSKERLFIMISQIPKATVQAAIGAIPLSLGLSCGDLVLTFAVVSILITAPLGAFLIDVTHKKLLTGINKQI